MKKIWLLAALLALSPVPGSAQTADELLNDGKNTDNVLIHSMGNGARATARSSRSTRPTSSAWFRSGARA